MTEPTAAVDTGERKVTPGTLFVQILSAKGVLWEGEAEAVSSVNSQGPFDLLPDHAHFISLVRKKPVVILMKDGEKSLKFDTAVIRLFDNKVTIYVDIA